MFHERLYLVRLLTEEEEVILEDGLPILPQPGQTLSVALKGTGTIVLGKVISSTLNEDRYDIKVKGVNQ